MGCCQSKAVYSNILGSTPSESVNKYSSDVYHVFLHTGSKFPQADSVKKWDQGTIKLTINPGSNNDPDPEISESEELKISGKFPKDSEGTVDVEFWIPRDKKVGEPELLKIEIDGKNRTAEPLYIREVTVVWNNSLTFRFPVNNYLSAESSCSSFSSCFSCFSCFSCCCDKKETLRDACPPYLYLRSGKGTLKHQETEDFILKAREEEQAIIRSMVPWLGPDTSHTYPGAIPTHIAVAKYEDLPRFLKFRQAWIDEFETNKTAGGKKIVPPVVLNILGNCFCGAPPQRNFRSLADYADCFAEMGEKTGWKRADIRDGLKVGQIFYQDEEFARQIIQGPSSTKLRKLKTLPEKWQEGIAHLPSYAIDGEDLLTVIAEGRLYEVSNSETLEGIGHGGLKSRLLTGTEQTWYVVLADCLLYQSKKKSECDGKDAEERFLPVLIRLENKNDGKPQTWWHPSENSTNKTDRTADMPWLLAKMYFRCADWAVYAIQTHFSRSHALNEVFGISMYRNLPSAHPLFRLLQPHFHGIVGINVQARESLIPPGGSAFANFMSCGDKVPELVVNSCKELHYDDMIVPKDFERRGVFEVPNFYFRDDCMSLWNILLDYITEMVNLSYHEEDDVTKDDELQKFVEEICKIGFQELEGAGFPDSIDTKEKLVEYLTVLIFNVSVFHTGVNFQINKYLGYLPNAPPSLREPPPEQDDVVTLERVMNSLPQYEVGLATMVTTEVLGNFSPIERFYVETKAQNKLGYLGDNMAVAPEQEDCIKNMVKKMENLRDEITKRNVGKYLAYNVLSPENVPLTTQT